MKVTLEEKYDNCLALNIELEEIIEMQNIELMKKNREIENLNKKLKSLGEEHTKLNKFVLERTIRS